MLRLALAAGLAILPGACSTPASYQLAGKVVGGLLEPQPITRYCTVRPHLFRSWQEPLELSPRCRSEGWVRQVVRDIGEIDSCVFAERDVRLLVQIDEHGVVTYVGVEPLASPRAQACVAQTLGQWSFAPAARAGEVYVIYEPPAG